MYSHQVLSCRRVEEELGPQTLRLERVRQLFICQDSLVPHPVAGEASADVRRERVDGQRRDSDVEPSRRVHAVSVEMMDRRMESRRIEHSFKRWMPVPRHERWVRLHRWGVECASCDYPPCPDG